MQTTAVEMPTIDFHSGLRAENREQCSSKGVEELGLDV